MHQRSGAPAFLPSTCVQISSSQNTSVAWSLSLSPSTLSLLQVFPSSPARPPFVLTSCFPLDLPSVINHCHPTFRSRKPAASVRNSACAQRGRGKVKVCVCWGRGGGGCKSEYFKVCARSASLHFSQLVCEAFIAAHMCAVNMCVYVFARSDALDQN